MMLTDKDFLSFINEYSSDALLKDRLNRIIDEEMEKPEDKMDTELIEYCLDKINKIDTEDKKGNGDSNDSRMKLTLKKNIAIAASVAVFLIGALSLSLVFFDINLLGIFGDPNNNHILNNSESQNNKVYTYNILGSELVKELSDNGFDNILLPEAFFSDNFKIEKIEYNITNDLITADILFKNDNFNGSCNINKFSAKEIVPDDDYLNTSDNFEELIIGKTVIKCFIKNGDAVIIYKDNLTIYTIRIPLNLDEAVDFAKTIKPGGVK